MVYCPGRANLAEGERDATKAAANRPLARGRREPPLFVVEGNFSWGHFDVVVCPPAFSSMLIRILSVERRGNLSTISIKEGGREAGRG